MSYGFELVREAQISEINSLVRLYRHTRTGAELLSIENQDENKCFGVSFATPSTDSTGVPHILEHSVLGGSKKYPVKEPFVELIKGSLATFINAMTFPDRTVYPVASTNLKDFYNLIDVYLDAVFSPTITPETLQQEGWHYELESLDAPLTYKGVVFNEMKGVFSSPDYWLDAEARKAMFPDTAYRFEYGGDPRVIPDLTYEDFRKFYETYYHPSNARFYFYGDDDPQQRLKMIDEVLAPYAGKLEVNADIAIQAPFEAPRQVVAKYEAGEDPKSMMSVSWVMATADDPERNLALDILAYILMGTSASPLRKALVDSGLGEDVVSGDGDDLKQSTFTAGLKGIKSEDTPRIETLILDTLRQLSEDGIDPATVEAAINTLEFQLREYNTGRFPRGLAMFLDLLSDWTNNNDPFVSLAYEAPLAALKSRIAAGEKVFETLIKTYLLDNPHRVTVLLEPEAGINAQWEADEKARLAAIREQMSETELEQIIADTQKLRKMQETPNSPEALATLPMLSLDDIDKQTRPVPNEITTLGGVPVLYHDLFTNGIVYFDVTFDLHALPQAYLPYVALFSRALLEMGTSTQTFVQLSQRIGSKTGGIYSSLLLSESAYNEKGSVARLVLRGKATVAQTPDLLSILRDVLTDANFDDQERFRQLVLKAKASYESGLIPSGHMVVARRISAAHTLSGWASDQISGLGQLFFLRQLLTEIDHNWDSIRAKLEDIRGLLLNRAVMLANMTLDAANWATVQPQVEAFIGDLPGGTGALQVWQPTFARQNEGLAMPAQVNYVGKGANLYELGYQLDGAAYVVPRWLAVSYLWEKIRVMGGAYGGMANFDPHSGVFAYLSYRDPNLLASLGHYDKTAQFLREVEIDDDELTRAILGTMADIDAYQLPDAKGYSQMSRYLLGVTDERRQATRDAVLSVSVADIRAFADVLAQVATQGLVVVLGSQEALEAANADLASPMQITKVL